MVGSCVKSQVFDTIGRTRLELSLDEFRNSFYSNAGSAVTTTTDILPN